MWRFDGSVRPDFAKNPKEGQQSVWDYPRPPRIEVVDIQVTVLKEGNVLAEWNRPIRISETASPPTYYLPFEALDFSYLSMAPGSSFCEWKGVATYWELKKEVGTPVAWGYENPSPSYLALKKHIAFYPAKVDCFVAEERVEPQPGGFYGGWLTSDICGPVKGSPGTEFW